MKSRLRLTWNAAAPMQDAIGEDVPAFQVSRDLDFIDRQERHVEIPGHRFHGGNPEPCFRRFDLFFAGNQRNRVHTGAIDDLVIDLACQQTQRQTDHARGMGEHPLDRQMGLAGVGGPKHRGNPGAGGPLVCENRR